MSRQPLGPEIRPFSAEQPLPPGIRETGPVAGTQRLQQRIEFLAQADALKRPHHLTVHGYGPGQCIDLAVALKRNDAQARVPEQRGRGGAHRPHADNGNVVILHWNSRDW